MMNNYFVHYEVFNGKCSAFCDTDKKVAKVQAENADAAVDMVTTRYNAVNNVYLETENGVVDVTDTATKVMKWRAERDAYEKECDERYEKMIAREKRAKERAKEREIENAAKMGVTVEEYKKIKRAEANKRKAEREIAEMEKAIEEKRKAIEYYNTIINR